MKKKYLLILFIILSIFIFTGCEKKTKLVENKDYSIDGEFTGKYLDITKRVYYMYGGEKYWWI